jgi:hypothetical protein
MNRTLQATFDGQVLRPDEPLELQPNTRVRVTIELVDDDERVAWTSFSAQGLAAAYGEDEPEYSLDQIKEPNPEYEGG